jgi:hypothetical protein
MELSQIPEEVTRNFQARTDTPPPARRGPMTQRPNRLAQASHKSEIRRLVLTVTNGGKTLKRKMAGPCTGGGGLHWRYVQML